VGKSVRGINFLLFFNSEGETMTHYRYIGTTRNVITLSGLLISPNFTRIIQGGRGDYVEIPDNLILKENIHIPPTAQWRFNEKYQDRIYYHEYRSNCDTYIKIYYQLKPVEYSDYQIGFYYTYPKALIGFEKV